MDFNEIENSVGIKKDLIEFIKFLRRDIINGEVE